MGYFSPEPKKRREDFFDMEREWNSLDRALDKGKLAIVTGLRRYGKTSLILTYINERRDTSTWIAGSCPRVSLYVGTHRYASAYLSYA